jgi:large subunit ribosomal protein L23
MRDSRSIIKKIQVTEKGSLLVESNKYTFEVATDSNKVEIKRAVEGLFDVKVTAVNTMNYTGKKKRMRTAKYGKRSDWKRAIVTLAEGNKIDMA